MLFFRCSVSYLYVVCTKFSFKRSQSGFYLVFHSLGSKSDSIVDHFHYRIFNKTSQISKIMGSHKVIGLTTLLIPDKASHAPNAMLNFTTYKIIYFEVSLGGSYGPMGLATASSSLGGAEARARACALSAAARRKSTGSCSIELRDALLVRVR